MADNYTTTRERAAKLVKAIKVLQGTAQEIIDALEPTSGTRENIVTAREKLADAVNALSVI